MFRTNNSCCLKLGISKDSQILSSQSWATSAFESSAHCKTDLKDSALQSCMSPPAASEQLLLLVLYLLIFMGMNNNKNASRLASSKGKATAAHSKVISRGFYF